jgi:hypothetical protein
VVFLRDFGIIRLVQTENSMTERCVTGQVPVITRFSRSRSESPVTIDCALFGKVSQVVVSVWENELVTRSDGGNTKSDKNVIANLSQNTSGFSTYIGQVR